jgi:hypothetical protein
MWQNSNKMFQQKEQLFWKTQTTPFDVHQTCLSEIRFIREGIDFKWVRLLLDFGIGWIGTLDNEGLATAFEGG